MSDSSFEVSSTMTVSIPEKSPSCESMLIERNRILSSLLMMEVMMGVGKQLPNSVIRMQIPKALSLEGIMENRLP